MPQNLIRLPKTAEFVMGEYQITIWNHEYTNESGLFTVIMSVSNGWPIQTLYLFENNGVSYEALIECCTHELEYNARILAHFINWYCIDLKYTESVVESTRRTLAFSKSEAGRKIAIQFVEKIRSCGNWDELYDEMKLTGKFGTDIKKKIKEEMKQWDKV